MWSLVVRAVSQLLYLCCMLPSKSFLHVIWRGLYCLCIWSIKFLENMQAFRDLNKLGSSNWNLWMKCGYIKTRETQEDTVESVPNPNIELTLLLVSQIRLTFSFTYSLFDTYFCMHRGNGSNAFRGSFL